MPRLKILPGNIANMIAAGEVVQRPASVVKELVENAVDAGATSVTVAVTDAGRTVIQVIDNGCGMSPDDAVLCFERHATSKIATAEDLNEILTYGFRGEALASIAAVAEVTLKTRRQCDELATEVRITDYNHMSTSQTSAPAGSNFIVRNLFYNTPARRKFLKSDAVELKHIVEEFTRVALTRPDVGFVLTSNGRELYVLKPAKSLKFRVMDLLGTNVVGDVVEVDTETTAVKITGFVGKPDSAKKTLGNQFFFANGRYFRSAYMHKAVMKAYEDFIPEGVTPSYFLYLEVDPHAIDVNIHPTKTEIKFEDDSVIFQILYACVKETLGRNAFGASIDFEAEGSVSLPVMGGRYDEYRPVSAPVADFDPSYNPFAEGSFSETPAVDAGFPSFGESMFGQEPASQASAPAPSQPSSAGLSWSGHVSRNEDYGRLFEEKTLPDTKALIIQGRYILAPVRSGVMAVNVRRAQERILFEKFLRALAGTEHVTQTSLFPEQVQVGVSNRLLFESNASMLQSLGFDIVPFGNDTIVVNGVPEGYSCEPGKVETLVADLLLILSDEGSSLRATMASSTATKFAKLGAATAKAVTSPIEAQNLIDTLISCENAEFTAGGQRIISIMSMDELDGRFN
ncbi:MAG: DNA mismatch repair endonuclease MutL [Bacteroidales bacterium]|nr:DNA mismatch repair endonuclease MutL [Candidatus Cryptobacteroides onthequi]